MKLDIIIPHYKEPWSTCKYLFDSIAMQRGILFDNIKCIVVNDGENESTIETHMATVQDYPYEVEILTKEHAGVSAARNYGLEHSDADYVMFCDIDDGFLNNYALHLIFCAMQEGFDFLYANFIEETFSEDGSATITRHDKDLTFMHGKVYRRQFLLDHDLWFDPKMTIHEDGYFNMLCYVVSQREGKQRTIDTPIYMWRWNDNSVVRSNREDFVLRTYNHVMLTRDGICQQLKDRGYASEAETAIVMTVLNSYYDFQKPSYHLAKNQRLLRLAEHEFKMFWLKYKEDFNNCTKQKVAEIAKASRANACNNGMLMERQDIRSWLKHIEQEVQ